MDFSALSCCHSSVFHESLCVHIVLATDFWRFLDRAFSWGEDYVSKRGCEGEVPVERRRKQGVRNVSVMSTLGERLVGLPCPLCRCLRSTRKRELRVGKRKGRCPEFDSRVFRKEAGVAVGTTISVLFGPDLRSSSGPSIDSFEVTF